MSNFVVNKKSLHYKVNLFARTTLMPDSKYYFETYKLPKDFCSYWRMTFFSVLYIFFLFTVASLLLMFFGFNAVTNPIPFFTTIAAVVLVFAMAIGLVYLKEMMDDRKQRRLEFKKENNIPDNIVVTRYKSWKEKYCPSVTYE